jgi:CBS domain-containing protein
MATAADFCSHRVVIASRGETLHDAAQRMREEHVGCVVVADDRPDGSRVAVGILTDRDIVVGVLARADQHVHKLTVGDVMTSNVVTARENDSLDDVLKRMRRFGVRRLPVVDDEGALAGIISFDDLVEYVQEQVSDLAALVMRERQHEADARR